MLDKTIENMMDYAILQDFVRKYPSDALVSSIKEAVLGITKKIQGEMKEHIASIKEKERTLERVKLKKEVKIHE